MKIKQKILTGLLAALALALLIGCAAKPAAKPYRCTVGVVCDDALAHVDALEETLLDILPDDGVMLPAVTVEFSGGETAWDAFLTAAQSAKLQYESDGTGESAYLIGIGNLYTGDAGDDSGWVFEVNGESPDVGCGRYELQDGDAVTFRYVYDFNEYFSE